MCKRCTKADCQENYYKHRWKEETESLPKCKNDSQKDFCDSSITSSKKDRRLKTKKI